MKEWWQEQSQRDRRIVRIGAIFASIALLYLLLWQPLHQQRDKYRQQITDQRQLLQWMHQRSAEARALMKQPGGQSGQPRQPIIGSLLSLVDKQARKAGLGKGLKRVEPAGADQVRLWFDAVEFSRLVAWLGSLESEYGTRIESAVIDRTEAVGQVNARLVINRG
jgi:general secretion pathway protein M